MIKPHTTIEPLREDLERLVPDSFLTTTEYKRWLVANNLQELWAKCLDYSQASQSSIVLGYQASIEAGDAMTLLLNHLYDTSLVRNVQKGISNLSPHSMYLVY